MKPHRLWPVLFGLAVFLGFVAALGWTAGQRDPTFEVIHVARGTEVAADEEATDQRWQRTRPINDEHARARQLLRRGDIEEAISFYAEQVMDPETPVFLLTEYSYALRQLDRCEEAEAVAREAAAEAPEVGDVQLSLALALRCVGLADEARQAFDAALRLSPYHSNTRLSYGEFLQDTNEHRRAIEILQPATDSGSNEERARALAMLGVSLFVEGDRASARDALHEAVERAPAFVSIWISVASAYLISDDPVDEESALQHALQASRLAPELAEPLAVVGAAYERLARPLEAVDAYKRAAELDRTDEHVRTRIVRLGLDEEELAAARRAASELLELDPDSPEYRFLHGLASARSGNPDDARESYNEAIRLRGGDYAEAWYNLGILERDAGNLDASKEAYVAAIELRPDYEAAWNNLGLVHHDLGEFGDAERSFLEAARIRENYAAAWINLGRTYAAQNSYALAADAWERALRIQPSNRSVRVRLGLAYRQTDRLPQALATLRDLVRDEPRYVAAWYNLGATFDAAGRPDEAYDAFRKALEIDPNHQASMRSLGVLESRRGETDSAWQHLTEALDLDPNDLEARLAVAELALRRGDIPRCVREFAILATELPDEPRVRALAARCGR